MQRSAVELNEIWCYCEISVERQRSGCPIYSAIWILDYRNIKFLRRQIFADAFYIISIEAILGNHRPATPAHNLALVHEHL